MSTTRAFTAVGPVIGEVQESHFKIAEIPLPELEDSMVHIKVLHASVDPYLYVL